MCPLALCLLAAIGAASASQQSVLTTVCWDAGCNECKSTDYHVPGHDCLACFEGFKFDSYGNCRHEDWCPSECTACDSNSSFACLSCANSYVLADGACNYDYYDYYYYNDNYCNYEGPVDEWYWRMMVGTGVGVILCIPLVVISSLPVCCGCKLRTVPLTRLAGMVGFAASLCNFIPLISSVIARKVALDNRCCIYCSTPSDLRSGGVVLAYLNAGWIVVVLATVAEILSCCMCSPLCGPLLREKEAARGGVGPVATQVSQASVIGQPVGESNC